MFYVALFPSILFPNNSKLCSAREMRLPFVYLYASAFVLFVTGVAMEHFSTHRFIRKQRKTLGRAFGERKLNFALQLNGSKKRKLLAPSFVLVTFCNYLSQRQSNVFDNKFNDSIFVFTLKTAWNNLFLNLIQRQTLCNKTFCRRKIVTLFLYWNLDFGILSIVRGNSLGRLIFALVCNVFRQV